MLYLVRLGVNLEKELQRREWSSAGGELSVYGTGILNLFWMICALSWRATG